MDVSYEEEDVSGEVKGTYNIQLQSNEVYSSIHKDNNDNLPNTAYGQVQL